MRILNSIYFRSLMASSDRFSLETRASSTPECGEVLFVYGERRVSRVSCEGMGSIAFGLYLTVPSNSRRMNNSRRCVCCSEPEFPGSITSSAVVHLKWEETAGYPHPIGQRCPGRHYFCLFVLSDMLRGLAIFFNNFVFGQAQHTH